MSMRIQMIGALGAACLTLAACEPGPQDQVADACRAILTGDPLGNQIAQLSRTSVPDYCACYGQRAVAAGQNDLALSVLTTLHDIMEETGAELEPIAEGLDEKIDADPAAYTFTAQQLDDIGEALEDTAEALLTGECLAPL